MKSISDNIRSLLRVGKVQKEADGNDYIVLASLNVPGTLTNSYREDTREYIIKVSDFLAGLQLEEFCDITLKPLEITNLGEEVSFEKANYADSSVVKDIIIPGVLEITRDDSKGIYNSAVETSYDTVDYLSPIDTEWASLITDPSLDVNDYANYPTYNYEPWAFARDFSGWPNPGIVGYDFIMRHVPSNRYWIVRFTQWTQGGGEGVPGGGGFAYTRQEVFPFAESSEPCKITFSDGTFIDTAPEVNICTIDLSQPPTLGELQSATFPSAFGGLLGPAVIVPGVVELYRDIDFGGWVFNGILEPRPDYFFGSPQDTEWNTQFTDLVNNGHSNLGTIPSRTFDNFVDAFGGFGFVGNNIVGLEAVLRVISTNQYFLVKFTDWNSGARNGPGPWMGYALEWQEVTFCSLTLPDGSVLSSLPPNTAEMSQVAFVDPVVGNDLTGVVGDQNLPFRTITQAQSAIGVQLVYCEPGIHTGTVTMVPNISYYFAPGAEKSNSMRDGGNSGTYRVYGHLRTTSFSTGFDFTGSTTQAFIECDELRGSRNLLVHNGAKAIVNCNRFFSNCNTGGRYAVYLRSGGKVVLNVKEDCRTYHWLVGGGYGSGVFTTPNEFTINCPDIRILDQTTAGNRYKALVNHQGLWACTYNINGFVTHEETTTLTSAFGVTESALALCVGAASANERGEFHFKGGCRTVAQPILIEYYINYDALFTFSDGDYYSGLSVITVGVAGVGGAATNNVQRWKNCRLDSYHRIGSIGHGRTMHFENCSFNVRSTDQPRLFDGDGSNPGAGTPNLYMYNCIGEYVVPGTVPFLNNPTGSVNFNTVNTYSSEPIGVGVTDNWAGYQQIIGFVVPKL